MSVSSVTPSMGWPETVLLLRDREADTGLLIEDGLREHGCQVKSVWRTDALSQSSCIGGFDLVLAYGPSNGSMLPAAQLILSAPGTSRPLFVWWLNEGVPDPKLPDWLVGPGAKVRCGLDRWLEGMPGNRLSKLLGRGQRLRILGELRWVQAHGVLDVLAVTSASRARYLEQLGFRPVIAPLGYHPIQGTALGLRRDVDVGFLGLAGTKRRDVILARVKADLERRGIEMRVFDGGAGAGYLYGPARTELLNRTKILLNIAKAAHDFTGQRFLLGAANKTLVVSEPVVDSAPFVVGRHLVAAPVEKLAETIEFYVSHDGERQKIVEEAYRFVTQELTIGQMIGRILDAVGAAPAWRERRLVAV